MAGVDKLAASLLGRPLLAWSLDAIAAAASVRRVIVVTAPERVAELAAASWVRAHDATVAAGGARRQESVAAGVALAAAEVVLVHDGARPLVSPQLVDAVADAARDHGAAVPVVPVAETLKRISNGRVAVTLDRTDLAAAQTPQGARRALLLDAFRRHDPNGPETFTDEAALFEASGVPVAAVAGDPANLKVTVPADLERAAALLGARLGPPRVGFGTDSHPFGPDLGLALGGILLPDAPRLHGHSDGDVALHAVADALLGAAGLGDLGRHFPAGDPATRGIASTAFVERVVVRLAEAGYRPTSVDLTITASRPRLGSARLEAMREVIARLLELPPDRVDVKASTGNLAGYEGAGRGVAAAAVAVVTRR